MCMLLTHTKKVLLGINHTQIWPSEHDISPILHVGQWLDITGYQDSQHGFWLANCEFGLGKMCIYMQFPSYFDDMEKEIALAKLTRKWAWIAASWTWLALGGQTHSQVSWQLHASRKKPISRQTYPYFIGYLTCVDLGWGSQTKVSESHRSLSKCTLGLAKRSLKCVPKFSTGVCLQVCLARA